MSFTSDFSREPQEQVDNINNITLGNSSEIIKELEPQIGNPFQLISLQEITKRDKFII